MQNLNELISQGLQFPFQTTQIKCPYLATQNLEEVPYIATYVDINICLSF